MHLRLYNIICEQVILFVIRVYNDLKNTKYAHYRFQKIKIVEKCKISIYYKHSSTFVGIGTQKKVFAKKASIFKNK